MTEDSSPFLNPATWVATVFCNENRLFAIPLPDCMFACCSGGQLESFDGFLIRSRKGRQGSGGRGRIRCLNEVWTHLQMLTNLNENRLFAIPLPGCMFSASAQGSGLVCGQCFQGNIPQHIGSVTLLRRIGSRRLWLRLFWGGWLQNKSKLHLWVANANESTRSRFWACLWQMLQGNISQHISSVTLLRRIGLRRLWLRLFWGTCLPNKSKLHL